VLAKFARIWLVFAFASFLLLCGCNRPTQSSPAVRIYYQVAPQPPVVGAATIMVILADGTAKPVTGARVRLEGDMSHAGMAPVFGEAGEVAPGRYQANLDLAMAGDWVILSHITLANGQKIEDQLDLKGVRSN
jgi:YtkA-like protein